MENKKQKILVVHNYYQIQGGEDIVVQNEKRLLKKHGHKVIFYSRNNSELKDINFIRKLLLPFIAVFNIKTYIDVKRIIKKDKIDIVHVHNTLSLISPSVYYAAVKCKVPIVQTVHNFRLLCPGATFYRDGNICEECIEGGLWCAIKHGCYRGSRLQTLICAISTKIHRMTGIYGKLNYICLTEFNKNKLLALEQIKGNQIYVKPNFTYEPYIKNETGEFYLFIGRLENIKGIPMLLEAFKRMPDKYLVLAGTGLKFDEYKLQTKKFDNINFKGFVQRNELYQLLKRTKAVIVTSQWYETFGMIVVEAFASQVPVIVGDIGNVGGLVDDGINGIKFQYNSVDALVQAIKRFEQLDRKVLGRNALKKYELYFEQNRNYEIMQMIYNCISFRKIQNDI